MTINVVVRNTAGGSSRVSVLCHRVTIDDAALTAYDDAYEIAARFPSDIVESLSYEEK